MDFCYDGNVTQDIIATYGNIAKVVCAAEGQQSAFDFISADCDLCWSGVEKFHFDSENQRAAESLQLHGLLL